MNQKHMDKCPICNNDITYRYKINFLEIIGISEKYEEKIAVCSKCKHAFVTNPLENSVLEKYYTELSKYEVNPTLSEIESDKIKMSQRQLDFINNSQIKFNSVLDIGASMGFHLNSFKVGGHDVYGIEPSMNNVTFAKKNYDINMFQGTFENYFENEKLRKYDLISMSHLLEHIVDPLTFLKNVKSINNKYLFIEVPTLDYQTKSEPYGLFFVEHIGYFTVESLSHLMKIVGYKPISINIEFNQNGANPGYPTLVTLWEIGEGHVIEGIFSSEYLLEEYMRVTEIEFETIRKKIDSIKNGKIAVWGTGSHTSRLLGMTRLKDKNIVKFYDSDLKKHQYKMLGKEITGFDVDDIRNGIIDTIIISTFSGEKSILNYLNRLDITVKIVPLYN